MNIDKLEYFIAAAELENFTKAAEKCMIAQTTMSKYISQLESELDAVLFFRTNKGCALTEKGRILYEHAVKIRNEYSEMVSEIKEERSGELNIGFDGSHFFVPIFREFQLEYPDTAFNVSVADEKQLVNQLLQRKLSAVVMPDSLHTRFRSGSKIRTVDILRAEEYLVLSRDVISRFGSIEAAIEHLPFITKSYDESYHSFCRENLRKKLGVTFRDAQSVQSQDVQNTLLAISQGFSIMPLSEIKEGMDFAIYPLGDDFVERLQLFYCTQSMSAPLRRLVSFIRERGVMDY